MKRCLRVAVLVLGCGLLGCESWSKVAGRWITGNPGVSPLNVQVLVIRRNGTFTLEKEGGSLSGKWELLEEDKLRLTFDDFRLYPRVAWFQVGNDQLVQLRALREGSMVFRRAPE